MGIIYLLKKNGEVVYVGKADNIDCADNRIQCHRRDKKFDQVEYLETDQEILLQTENDLILDHLPKYNKTAKKNNYYSSTTELKDFIYDAILAHLDISGAVKHVGNRKYINIEKFDQVDIGSAFSDLSYQDYIVELREFEKQWEKDREEERKAEKEAERIKSEKFKEEQEAKEKAWMDCIQRVKERVSQKDGTDKQIDFMEGLLSAMYSGNLTYKQSETLKNFGGYQL